MKILAFGPHPDDIEIGCGGTIIKLMSQGWDLSMVVASKGERGGDEEQRMAEQYESFCLLGKPSLRQLDYPDTLLDSSAMTYDFDKIIGDAEPDIILGPYYEDSHPDHRAVSKALISAVRKAGSLLFYEIPLSTQNFRPTVFVDIEDSFKKKEELADCYESQLQHYETNGYLKTCARFRGMQARLKLAEGFMPWRYIWKINQVGGKDNANF